MPETKPALEVNLAHPLVRRLEAAEEARFEDLARVLLGQAEIAEGDLPADPGDYVGRLNRLLVELSG